MTALTGKFQTELPVYEAIVACAEAIDGLGWDIEAVEASRIVSHVDTGSPHPPKIEVVLRESGQVTVVRIIGTDTDAEPLSEDELIAELDRVRDAIKASLARATEAPPQDPPTGQTSASPAGPMPATVAREPGRARRDPGAGRRRLAIAGIVVGLLAIGLGIVGFGFIDDSSEDRGRDRAGIEPDRKGTKGDQKGTKRGREGNESKGTSGSNQSQGPAVPGQQSSGGGDLGEKKEIRDGDERLALTPTGVGREGSYITLEIEVAGLGNAGYDTTGLESRGTLFGSNGQGYEVRSSGGPGGCEPPTATLKNGRTLDGCLPFKVPEGTQADRFQYQPFFVGGDSAEWNLE